MGASLSTPLTPDIIQQLRESKEAKALVGWVHSEYEKAKGARQRFERQWAVNMAFYRGKQNAVYFAANSGVPGAGKLLMDGVPAPSYKSRSVTNRIRPIIRTEIARLTSNKPNASVVPASSEDMDLFAAQAGEQIWQSIYSGRKLLKVYSRAAFWQVICGVGFTKIWWDPNAYDDLTKMPGSIQYGVVTPYHLFVPDLYEEDLEDQPYIFNVYTKSAQWVQTTYGIAVNPSVVSAQSPFDNALMSIMGPNDSRPDSVLVIEAWFKPNSHQYFPNGGFMTIVDDTIVAMHVEGMPYVHNQYPFIKWEHIPTGMFYPESVITDLIGPQREYNRTKNQIIEAKNRMGKPQLIAPKGSVVASKITSAPGQLIEYKPGLAPPQPLPIQPLPSYITDVLERELIDMEDISAQHAASRGETPNGVTAATAISFMQERDDSVLTSTYQSVEEGWEKMAKQTLSHVVQFWDTKRTISVTGLDGSFDSVALKGTELSKGTDIRMEAGSALPVSKAARQAFLIDMMKNGFIDPTRGLELMDMGGIERLYDELKIDERQAQRENLRMARLEVEQIMQHEQMADQVNMQSTMQPEMGMGMPADPMGAPVPPQGPEMGTPEEGPAGTDTVTGAPLQIPMNMIPVNTWDNHQLHIEVHNRFRKSQAFELLSEAHKSQFEAHVMQHAMVLNEAAQAAMMMPPPPDMGGNPMSGADNGSGSPLGNNQFGPPGTEDGAPPPEMMGMQ